MTQHRFQNILAALHICKIKEDAANEHKKKVGQQYAPLLKVKNLSLLIFNCPVVHIMSQVKNCQLMRGWLLRKGGSA